MVLIREGLNLKPATQKVVNRTSVWRKVIPLKLLPLIGSLGCFYIGTDMILAWYIVGGKQLIGYGTFVLLVPLMFIAREWRKKRS